MEAIAADKEEEKMVKNIFDKIKFQSEYVDKLAELTVQRSVNLTELFHQWIADRTENISTFREKTHHKSKFH